MKRTGMILITLAFTAWGFSVDKIYAEDNRVKAVPLNISISDERFSLTNISFFKRLDKVTMSLNANLDFENNTDQDIKLKVILIAFRQVDSADKSVRKWIKYPSWRKRDLDKEQLKVTILDSTPVIDKNAVDSDLKDSRIYPDFQKYLQYIANNPSVGNDIVIKGLNTGVSENSGSENFYVVSQAMKTSVFAKLKVRFNRANDFFNNFGIIIVDTEQKKVVGSELYYFDAPFKTQ